MRDLIIRAVLGSPCLLIAAWQFREPNDRQIAMLCVFPCLMAYALIIFPSATSAAASAFTGLFFPQRDTAPKPELRRAQTLRYRGDYHGTLVEYERLLASFPRDLDLWNACFELILLKLEDPEHARRMLSNAKGDGTDPEFSRRLDHLFRVQLRRFEERAPVPN